MSSVRSRICQSAPNAGTSPESRGPENVPPRMGMIRRRPSGSGPPSIGTPTATAMRKSKSSEGKGGVSEIDISVIPQQDEETSQEIEVFLKGKKLSSRSASAE